ncbi:MAG: hypothetical protein IID32_00540 [Planctomycetes bacterium]|nr:hypothetical protein [Planctomycetota bacterium]
MQPNDKEFTELFAQLNIDESERQEILRDITQGDELLKRQIEPDLPKGLIERIEEDLLSEPVTAAGRDQKRWVSRSWLRPTAAVIAAGVLVAAIVMLDRNPSQTTPENPVGPVTSNSNDQVDLLYDEFGLWITASTFEEELDEEMNDLAISEILVLWDAAGWEIENILGKEKDNESDTILTRHRVGAFVV